MGYFNLIIYVDCHVTPAINVALSGLHPCACMACGMPRMQI